MIDRITELTGEIERAADVERALPLNQLLQRFTSDVLHHDEEHAVLFFGGQHRDDVRMIERGEEPGFLDEIGEIQVLLVRHLDGDLLVNPGVFSEEHAAETAAAERREDPVLSDMLTLEEHGLPHEYTSQCEGTRV